MCKYRILDLEFTKNIDLETILSEDTDLTQYMDDGDLDNLGALCVEEFDIDEESRSDYIEQTEDAMRLAMQVKENKSFPWNGAANIKYPLISIAAMQFGARAYANLLPDQRPVKGKIIGYDRDGSKMEKAVRVGKHMSYQLLEEMEEWEEDMDRLCMVLPILGCTFKKTYYNPTKQRNVSELVLPKELVVNYWTNSLDNAARISHIIEYTTNDLVERVNRGMFRDIDLPENSTQETSTELRTISDEISGMTGPARDEDEPLVFIEQHRYLDLDGDGYSEPYIVTVSLDNNEVYRIVRRFSDLDVERQTNGDVLKITADQYFTKFPFIPNPDGGFYDIGFGTLLGPTNEAVNTIFNQLVDAGTLSNMQSGFLGRGIRLKKGSMAFSPGEWKQVNNTGDDLRKSIVPLPIREPSNVLFNLLGLLMDSGKELSAVSDMMQGKNPGQNQAATTTMAVLEQGLQVYSSIYKRIYRSLKKEYKKLYKLNSLYMPMESYFQILDYGEQEGSQINGSDYDLESIDVVPSADPNVASEAQKLMKAQGLQELLQLGTVNPVEVTKRILEAQNQAGIELLMQVEPPQPDPELVLKEKQLMLDEQQAQDESDRDWARIQIEAKDKEVQLELNETKVFLDNSQKDKDRQSKEDMERMKNAQQSGNTGMAS